MALLYHIYSWFSLVVTMQFKAYQAIGSGDKTNQSADSTGKAEVQTMDSSIIHQKYYLHLWFPNNTIIGIVSFERQN